MVAVAIITVPRTPSTRPPLLHYAAPPPSVSRVPLSLSPPQVTSAPFSPRALCNECRISFC